MRKNCNERNVIFILFHSNCAIPNGTMQFTAYAYEDGALACNVQANQTAHFLHVDIDLYRTYPFPYNKYISAAIVIKPSNIRIWIHDKDVGKLSKVVWEGQGNRLRTEVSSNAKVKRFLEAVPYVMVCMRDLLGVWVSIIVLVMICFSFFYSNLISDTDLSQIWLSLLAKSDSLFSLSFFVYDY